MFCQTVDQEPQSNTIRTRHTYPQKRKNKRKFKNKDYKKDLKRKYTRLSSVMSNWAESFTVAATWQIKHQLAFWKARAKALEYENTILHDIIRKKSVSSTVTSGSAYEPAQECDSGEESSEPEEDDNDDDRVEDNDELVVSEEYIQFLIENEKYRQDAKRERERFRAKAAEEEKLAEEMQAAMSRVKTKEEKEAELKELYGDKWERIQALETSLEAKFIDDCDRDKPPYWPVIPLNFG